MTFAFFFRLALRPLTRTRTMHVVERYMRMILKDELEGATINRLRLGRQANTINLYPFRGPVFATAKPSADPP